MSVGGGANFSNTESDGGPFTSWFPVELYLSGPDIGQDDNNYLTVDTSTGTTSDSSGSLFDPGPGTLAPTSVSESPDGQTLTTTWSNQLLAGLNLNFASINNIYAEAGVYLSGNGPITFASANGSHTAVAQTPFTTLHPAVRLSAALQNLSAADLNSETPGGDPQENYFPDLNPPSFRATGLPPGLRVNQAAAEIVGTPTNPGKYSSTITATTYYGLDGKPSYSANLKYDWTVTPAPLPVALLRDGGTASRRSAFASRPKKLTFTGDGSGYLAGKRGARSGAIRWSSWTASKSVAHTYEWDRFCTGCNGDSHRAYPVRVTLSQPTTEHGVRLFTRLVLVFIGRRPRANSPRISSLHAAFSYGAFAYN